MSVRSIEALQRYLRRLCDEAVPSEDAVLLKRFVAVNDREAFELLIARHAPMVLGTARRLVDHAHDAEDVFQAVFLSLARLAKTIHHGRTLPAWLHKATCRIATKVRKNRGSGSKEPPPEPCENIAPEAHLVWQEVRQALDEELRRLPERWRSPLLLCYLSGLTRDEAARQLGWSLGTLKRRLEEGRKALRSRLDRRGIATVGLALTVLTPEALQAAVSKSLLESSLSLIFATGVVARATISALVLSSANSTKGLAMKSILALLAAVGVGVGIYAGMGQADPPKKAGEKKAEAEAKPDQEKKVVQMDDPVPGPPPRPAIVEAVADRGDPLPEGAVLRFGTSRYRQGTYIYGMTVSADGKLAAVTSCSDIDGAVRAFDLTNGRVVYSLAGRQYAEAIAFSPDGKTLLTRATDARITPKLTISLFEAATGKELRKVEFPETDDRTRTLWVTFTPDGKFIALTKGNAHGVVLVDLEKGAVARTFPHDAEVYAAAISPDGTRMAAGGEDGGEGKYFTRLWEVASGKELLRLEHGEGGLRTIAFSPDGKTVAGGGHGKWARLWDVETGKELRKFPKAGNKVQSVAFAPDGRTLAVASGWSSVEAICIYDLATGDERVRINRDATCLHFSPDGKVLTGAASGTIHQWDATTGKPLTPQMAGESDVEQVLVTRDTRQLLTRYQSGNDAQLWDATTGERLKVLKATLQCGIALSPDSRYVVWPPIWDAKIQYKDPIAPDTTRNGMRLRLYDTTTDKFIERFALFEGEANDLFFTPDGRTLLTTDHRDGAVRVWDFATGKEQRKFSVGCKDEAGLDYYVGKAVLSPDGKSLAVTYQYSHGVIMPYVIRLWDVATGTKKYDLPGRYGPIDVVFSPDSRLAVACCQPHYERDRELPYSIYVWDTTTGKRTTPLPDGLPTEAVALAFADDGRTLATATPEGLVQLWEVASWTIRAQYRGHRGRVTSLTFASDGRLFTGGLDTTVLAWDIRPPRAADSVSLASAWNDLAARESGESFKSAGRFLAAPADTVKLFAEKIKPVEALDPRRITSEQIRQIRAVMLLELIGDVESKNLLKRWAGGPVGALLTMEASAALKRLEGMAHAKR